MATKEVDRAGDGTFSSPAFLEGDMRSMQRLTDLISAELSDRIDLLMENTVTGASGERPAR